MITRDIGVIGRYIVPLFQDNKIVKEKRASRIASKGSFRVLGVIFRTPKFFDFSINITFAAVSKE